MPKSKQIPEILETIGDHIKKRRLELGLFQKDLAERFGTSEDSISNWEKSEREPSFQFAPAIIDFLGYNPYPYDLSTFGGRIKYYRLIKGLSVRQFSKLLSVDKCTVGSWERNSYIPRQPYYTRIQELIAKG
ncbi:MAG: helix-turn-helix transcriptional regulator [Bacteroidetes bacterium]|nr:helix-turn-helix transcriptional regulator [Bacteroidota bacterium]